MRQVRGWISKAEAERISARMAERAAAGESPTFDEVRAELRRERSPRFDRASVVSGLCALAITAGLAYTFLIPQRPSTTAEFIAAARQYETSSRVSTVRVIRIQAPTPPSPICPIQDIVVPNQTEEGAADPSIEFEHIEMITPDIL